MTNRSDKIVLPSLAKINRFLRVLGKRDDGFHEIFTEFQTVSLADTISFEEADELSLSSNDVFLPIDERNLIIKAAYALQARNDTPKGAKIFIEKNIPHPGGLGGGSSNAAMTLLGLANLWNIDIDSQELVSIGADLGADVPFFFFGGNAYGSGNGAELTRAVELEKQFLIIVTPNIEIPTGEAFARLNAARLTNYSSESILQICRDYAYAVKIGQSEPINDFEASIFAFKPEIGELKNELLELGADSAYLSGSGASVFGIFDNVNDRDQAFESLNGEVRKFVVETISRVEYLRMLEACREFLPGDLENFGGA